MAEKVKEHSDSESSFGVVDFNQIYIPWDGTRKKFVPVFQPSDANRVYPVTVKDDRGAVRSVVSAQEVEAGAENRVEKATQIKKEKEKAAQAKTQKRKKNTATQVAA